MCHIAFCLGAWMDTMRSNVFLATRISQAADGSHGLTPQEFAAYVSDNFAYHVCFAG